MFGLFKAYSSELVKTASSEFKSDQAVIIDVREEDEIKASHIAGAVWIPLSLIHSDTDKAKEMIFDKASSKKLYFYCRSGNRSRQAINLLKDKGIEGTNLGGIGSLKKEFQVESGTMDCCS
tara:strand:+ start:213856 stop:214218 length:363 start_codon:yes stop_codon:yes gene_type:complete